MGICFGWVGGGTVPLGIVAYSLDNIWKNGTGHGIMSKV
jgi:hypothetical protein